MVLVVLMVLVVVLVVLLVQWKVAIESEPTLPPLVTARPAVATGPERGQDLRRVAWRP
jgi:hypothetical protein